MPLLVIQRGHCYRRSGATGTPGEQPYASAVANACVALLHGRGGWDVKAILADEDADEYRGDAFVAIHCDGSINSSARGASVGYRTPEGQRFGQAWKRAYAARGWPGFRADNYTGALQGYYGLKTAVSVGNRRAFIAECGFLTSPLDRALLTAEGGPTRVALAIGDALGIKQSTEEDDVRARFMQLKGYQSVFLVSLDGLGHRHVPNMQQLKALAVRWGIPEDIEVRPVGDDKYWGPRLDLNEGN